MSKHDLIDMIIIEKRRTTTITQKDGDLLKEEGNNLHKNIKTSNAKL